jgi:hypothetical protein
MARIVGPAVGADLRERLSGVRRGDDVDLDHRAGQDERSDLDERAGRRLRPQVLVPHLANRARSSSEVT